MLYLELMSSQTCCLKGDFNRSSVSRDPGYRCEGNLAGPHITLTAGKCRDFLNMVPRSRLCYGKRPGQVLALPGAIHSCSHFWVPEVLPGTLWLSGQPLPACLPTVLYLQQISSRVLISWQSLFTSLSLPSVPESLEARDDLLINFNPPTVYTRKLLNGRTNHWAGKSLG